MKNDLACYIGSPAGFTPILPTKNQGLSLLNVRSLYFYHNWRKERDLKKAYHGMPGFLRFA